MLSLAHTLISLPLGIYLENPWLILLGAIVVHLLCDMLLHWNIYPNDYPRFPYGLVALDVGGGVVLAALLVGPEIFSLPVLVAIAGGNLPDVLHSLLVIAGGEKNPRRFPRTVNHPFWLHHRIQHETRDVARGLASQIILVTLAILVTLVSPG